MKSTIIIVSLVVVAIGLLFVRGPGGASQSPALLTGTTETEFGEPIPAYDFGTISMVKGNVEHEFAVKNAGDADFVISRAETSCMCTRVVLRLPDGKEIGPFGMPGHGFNPSVNITIRPGEAVTARVIFDPAAHGPTGIGKVDRIVTLAADKGPITLRFRANVTP